MGASDKQQLLEFGFTEEQVERGLKATKNGGLQPTMDWILKHKDDPVEETKDDPMELEGGGEISAENATAQSLKCDECQKLFKNAAAAEFHAVKSGHQSFSESTAAIKPLTEEEKVAKLAELKERLALKKKEREAREKADAREAELTRRRTTREINDAKAELQEKEIMKALAEKKKEKEDDKKAKAKIRAQIEADKKERQRIRDEKKGLTPPNEKVPVIQKAPVIQNSNFTEARLQLRCPNAPPIVQVFAAMDTMEIVYEFLRNHPDQPIRGAFKIATTFPRKVLEGADMGKTLKELNLVPSSSLVVLPA